VGGVGDGDYAFNLDYTRSRQYLSNFYLAHNSQRYLAHLPCATWLHSLAEV
jgi:hypothetical protein